MSGLSLEEQARMHAAEIREFLVRQQVRLTSVDDELSRVLFVVYGATNADLGCFVTAGRDEDGFYASVRLFRERWFGRSPSAGFSCTLGVDAWSYDSDEPDDSEIGAIFKSFDPSSNPCDRKELYRCLTILAERFLARRTRRSRLRSFMSQLRASVFPGHF